MTITHAHRHPQPVAACPVCPKATRVYRDLEPGDRFHSPRPEKGIVTVLCPPGRCEHDRSRDEYGCHVFGPEGIRQQFFVNQVPTEPVRLAP